MGHLILLLSLFGAGTIAGTVREDPARTPVPFAAVEIVELNRGTTTDADGYYVLAGVPAGEWTLRVRALGYLERERVVALAEGEGVRVDFSLPSDPVDLDGVRVQVQRGEVSTGPPPVRIDLATLKRAPAYAEPDVLRAAQMVPAAQAVSDFSSALYVRGGAPDQTLITLDGIPLFNPYHAAGVVSSFTPEAVESVEVWPGGFGAGIGDRLSGAVAIRTRDAERDRYHVEGGLGLLSVRTTVSGPLPADAGLVVSARRTFSPLGSAIYRKGMIPQDLEHGFTDVLVRASRDIGPGGSVTFTAYADAEGLRPAEPLRRFVDYDWDWGSRVAGVRLRYPVSPALTTEIRAGVSTFGTTLRSSWRDGLEHVRTLDAEGEMRDLNGAAEASWHGRIHTVRLGVQLDAYHFDYSVRHGAEIGPGTLESYVPAFDRTDRLGTLAAYAEEELGLGPLTLRGGVRFLDAEALGSAWLPRVGLRLGLGRGLAVTAAAGRHAQAIHSLRSTAAALSSLMAYEVYATAPEEIGLATADEVTAGISWFHGSTSLRLDGYVRTMESLALPPIPSDPLTAPVLVPDGRVPGSGRARGLEVLLRHVRGEGGAWISYALQQTEWSQEGWTYAPRFERRHFVDAMVMLPLGERTTGSVRMMVGSGQPYTPTVAVLPPTFFNPDTQRLEDGPNPVGLLGEHNSARLRPYVRADFGIRHGFEREILGREVTLRPYFQVLNASQADNELNRARSSTVLPPCEYGEQYSDPLAGIGIGTFSCTQQTTDQFPLTLSIGVEWEY